MLFPNNHLPEIKKAHIVGSTGHDDMLEWRERGRRCPGPFQQTLGSYGKSFLPSTKYLSYRKSHLRKS